MIENPNDEGISDMNDESEPETRDGAKTDGLAAVGVLLITAVLIIVVITRII